MLGSEEEEPLLSSQDQELAVSVQPQSISCDPKLYSIFVVAFDTRAGNIIEWNYPDSFDLTGVEFKALPSGAHNVQHDIMLFEIHNYFGLAAYIMKQVDSVSERGARMKSVGVVCSNYLTLAQHEERLVEMAQDSVERPGDTYEHLIQYFTEFNEVSTVPLPMEMKPPMVGSMYDLLKSQGVNIFSLWKMLLLKKRILLHCTPPIARHCNYVLCLAALSYTQYTQPQPIFYVTVNDMTTLRYKESYIACSADAILKTKGALVYDVYVTGSAVLSDTDVAVPVTRGDHVRYMQLSGAVDRNYGNRNTAEVDRMILSYFTKLTEDLFSTLHNVMSGTRKMEVEDLRDVRLHTSDLPYLQTLVDKLGYDVELLQPGCCDEHFKEHFRGTVF